MAARRDFVRRRARVARREAGWPAAPCNLRAQLKGAELGQRAARSGGGTRASRRARGSKGRDLDSASSWDFHHRARHPTNAPRHDNSAFCASPDPRARRRRRSLDEARHAGPGLLFERRRAASSSCSGCAGPSSASARRGGAAAAARGLAQRRGAARRRPRRGGRGRGGVDVGRQACAARRGWAGRGCGAPPGKGAAAGRRRRWHNRERRRRRRARPRDLHWPRRRAAPATAARARQRRHRRPRSARVWRQGGGAAAATAGRRVKRAHERRERDVSDLFFLGVLVS